MVKCTLVQFLQVKNPPSHLRRATSFRAKEDVKRSIGLQTVFFNRSVPVTIGTGTLNDVYF
jgi:hypothetical protein